MSAWADSRHEVVNMVKWAEQRLKALGATTELADVGKQTLPDGRVIDLPPVLLGQLGNVSMKILHCFCVKFEKFYHSCFQIE